VSWSFTTGPAPLLSARTPAVGALLVPRGSNFTATFSEPVTGVSTTTVRLQTDTGQVLVPATVTYDAATRTATLNPNADLAPLTRYRAILTGGPTAIRDLAGNPFGSTNWTFTTGP
jgi:hypothetical protein